MSIASILCIVLTGCVNLKHVNDYSTSSLEGVKAFEEIHYGFSQSCMDRCMFDKINMLLIEDKTCNCSPEQKADSINLKIYNAIYGYFEGLSLVSDNGLATYRTDELENALTEGDFGSIKIEKEQVASYSRVARILINVFADSKRKSKIKTYVTEANAPIKELLAYLDFNLSSNLYGKLEVEKERNRAYFFDLTKSDSLSMFEKRQTTQEYYKRQGDIEKKQNKLGIYSKTLQKISEGHQELFDHLETLKAEEIKQLLFSYANEIDIIITEFKKTE
ncbi:hypothetical protein [Flagellimonas allohymeniacidonis]|uniref:Uncharacterized protein n=1 Tax=Flagellimonas allohymeniacidonis TaxID=2517819 RepID=A0A4Q8QCL8_9FLAO|nr:hypothetical protein [Allomuricauda hymeniacidonis]TAI48125.1 hypothetical protein EW142_15880 [Allomuricauda hymeniacidonis]